MESISPEIHIQILDHLSIKHLIRFSIVSKYFLALIRNYYWNFIIHLSHAKKETIYDVLSTYRFRECDISYRKKIDEIFNGLEPVPGPKVLKLSYCWTSGKCLHLFSQLSELYLRHSDGLLDESIVLLCQTRTRPFCKIDLGHCTNGITDISLEAIAQIGSDVLDISSNPKITDIGVQKIVASGKIRKLHLCGNGQLTEAAFDGITGVESLNLKKCNVTDDILKKMGMCNRLDLEYCNITDDGLLQLSRCSHLRLGANHQITLDGLITLLHRGTIRKLYINMFLLPWDKCIELAGMFPEVKIAEISIDDCILRYIRKKRKFDLIDF